VDLTAYDVILINSSAGKDSQAMLDYVAALAGAQGVTDRLHVVHCDLGRVEWAGTRDLAERQAAHYRIPFHVVRRAQGDLLEQVEARGMWPSPKQRYCTSDHKRGQVARLLTWFGQQHRAAGPVRILNCLGLRAEESPARAKKVELERDARQTNGRRIVDTWLPIHDWTTAQVWARIEASGVPHHPAYDLGMPRLSCCFCIFAPKAALVLAGRHNPELLAEYVAVERRIGHTFKTDLSLADVQAAVTTEAPAEALENWRM
jgi:3'-phosphoadenosine 5'-phosphosulfate sulfotransferase (PAPS reductase)/FAD synthetase